MRGVKRPACFGPAAWGKLAGMAELIPWHQLFGLSLADFFRGTGVRVELEKDLSLKQQLLDVVILRPEGSVLPRRLPDGFEPLVAHNLVRFKSYQEALDGEALDELVGHYVNYRKQVSPSMRDLLPRDQFRRIAVAARSPQNLAGETDLRQLGPGVYEARHFSGVIQVVVANELPRSGTHPRAAGRPAQTAPDSAHRPQRRYARPLTRPPSRFRPPDARRTLTVGRLSRRSRRGDGPMYRRWLATLTLVTTLATAAAAADVDYTRDVKPLLARHCVQCHGPQKQKAGLRLDTAKAIRDGGDSGPSLVPGKADDSRILHAVTGSRDASRMPPRGPALSPAEVALLRAWIDAGAKAPADEAAVAAGPAAPTHWAFRLVTRPVPPAVKDAAWCRTPVDRFVLARLEKVGLRPSPDADRVTLLRRLSLDLLGLPPTPEEVAAFVADPRPDAYERAVDRLLDSPHYGERQARHWLDLARYADSNGFNIDAPRSVWPYRDWVIHAFNRDLPFDRFTVEQLAGDLLPGAGTEQVVATGFHRNTLLNQEGGIDVEQFRVESVVDRVNTTGATWLGLTVGCAQCHDHKYDPVSQREFYRLFAFFNSCDEPTLELPTKEQVRRDADATRKLAAAEKRLAVFDPTTPARVERWERGVGDALRPLLPSAVREVLGVAPNGRTAAQSATLETAVRTWDKVRHAVGGLGQPLPFLAAAHAAAARQRETFEKRVAALRKARPGVTTTLVMRERATPRQTHVMLGGDFLRKGVAVTPGTPAALPPLPATPRPNRLDLARWLVSPEQPLTPRVVVNRLWQGHFGLGIVETENDFGTQGTPPSHPELLDWLASELVRSGWSVKHMHRLLVTSATYRQASVLRRDLRERDPRNVLLGRMPRLRLDAEVVRDNALAVSGLLARKVGGPGVFPPQPEGVSKFTQIQRPWQPSPGADRYRRGMYTTFWRSAPHPGLMVFDAPDSTTACTRRNRSNTPLQALTLLNDEAMAECAKALASRVLREATPADDAGRVDYAARLCLARRPTPDERGRLLTFLAREERELAADPDAAKALAPTGTPAGVPSAKAAAWTGLARVLLNLDETITRE
jgi:mono/diheme cytochrome c family protein